MFLINLTKVRKLWEKEGTVVMIVKLRAQQTRQEES